MSSGQDASSPPRGQFSSRLGFVFSAAGSAVGIGNIWGFPTQVADNGGAVFLVVYLLLSLLLAYPALVAELMIGRYSQTNPVTALERLPHNQTFRKHGYLLGCLAVITICLIFAFYSIIGGSLIAYGIAPIFHEIGMIPVAFWLEASTPERNMVMTALFIALTLAVVNGGVEKGIEKWSSRLMPLLIALLLLLIGCVMTQDGAMEGLRLYLVPDFSKLTPSLLFNALGQSFFSMSLGVGAMMAYGSYLSKKDNLPAMALQVCLLDTGIAVLAGLLVIPAMFVALHNGMVIYDDQGLLHSSDTLVFTVLPAFFTSLGHLGILLGILFFILMTIAALTSSISMLEVPVSCLVERKGLTRKKASIIVCLSVMLLCTLIITNFDLLFSRVVSLTTRYAQPFNAFLFCLFAGWLMHRNHRLQEIRHGFNHVENSLFWRIWPWYVRYLCPVLIAMLLLFG
ncbi:MAG: sodium-dependent transporter [Endozoicomonadaceae bacterium]|nr:sodium-dependent transporter [Endozoicomonadaceae bacterium]